MTMTPKAKIVQDALYKARMTLADLVLYGRDRDIPVEQATAVWNGVGEITYDVAVVLEFLTGVRVMYWLDVERTSRQPVQVAAQRVFFGRNVS